MSQLRAAIRARSMYALDEALEAAVGVVHLTSDHNVVVRQGQDMRRDLYYVTVFCKDCLNQRTVYWPGMGLVMEAYREMIEHRIVPLFAWFMETECWSLADKQLMAEYITERLVEAGAAGLRLSQLLHDIVTDRLAPRGDVCRAMDDLAFETWGEDGVTRVRLPLGHPLREW